ncbi:MAG: PAS domain-containing sensor histidine kinase [Bdellovibrionaceae bacterium]|nr:PAS domain-containing sensor histidine kinase [Pseudobdellovibrionaceae bacterium]
MNTKTPRTFNKEASLSMYGDENHLPLYGLSTWKWSPLENTVVFDENFNASIGCGSVTANIPFTWKNCMHPDDLDAAEVKFQSFMNTSSATYEDTQRFRHQDGSWHYFLLKAAPRDSSQNEINGICIDISCHEKKVWNDKENTLRMQNQSKLIEIGKMAGSIAHEINNPLSVIRMNAELLVSTDPEQIKAANVISKCARIIATTDRISSIIRALRSISASARKPNFAWISLNTVIGDVLELCQHRIRDEHIELNVDMKDILMMQVFIDHAQISQAIINLLNNSCNAIKNLSNRWIELQASADADTLYIRVTDSGTGISDNIASQMNEQFYTTNSNHGLGIGLNLVKSYVESHNGKIGYEMHKGHTSFKISLPLATVSPQQEEGDAIC